jgi:hypothetical protein
MATGLALPELWAAGRPGEASKRETITLPVGSAPEPVEFPHFPSRLHAFIWRNWTLVPVKKIAAVVRGTPREIRQVGKSMGLPEQRPISREQQRRSYITILRRNWHLLPYEQLLELVDWTAEHMAYMLREDDFLFIKLGSLKPKCEPLRYRKPNEAATARAREIAAVVRSVATVEPARQSEPLFSFVSQLSRRPEPRASSETGKRKENKEPRFCYSYFALYGDPLLEPDLDPYPEGYLERLAALGVNGVWLQGVLQKLAPLPWTSENEREQVERLKNLRALVKRAARRGIGIYLYLNEPRTMPETFFATRPELKGAPAGDHASVCTSVPAVRNGLRTAIAHIVKAVPDLAGFFTITASENPTNCWSHGASGKCSRCGKRAPEAVIAEVNATLQEGIEEARRTVKTKARLMAWDWGWPDSWAEGIIARLPTEVTLQSVSEWSIPIKRGGVNSVVGEYSISTVGPGPRATRHWELARKRGMRTSAKIQAGNTWELSAVPYIPAVENVARHVARLKGARVDGLMLGWTLGGYPSPNLEVACMLAREETEAGDLPIEERVERALKQVAVARFGPELAPNVVRAWSAFSAAFSEYPYHVEVVYKAPMQYGPANLLWAQKTGYKATMVGFPYDDLTAWRNIYPPDVFIRQFRTMADGFDRAIQELRAAVGSKTEVKNKVETPLRKELEREIDVARAGAIHFRSTANQARYVQLRDAPKENGTASRAEEMRAILREEQALALELRAIQLRDSRIGFEATNHYFYVPQDLLEKVINCRWLLELETD